MSPRAIMIGMPGVGKTTVGRRVAYRLRVDFLDADEAIEHRTGRSVREIFAEDGEAAFRELEAEVIAETLSGFGGVLAVGGGALLAAATRERIATCALSGSCIILLVAELAELRQRVGDGARRPLLAGDVLGRLSTLAADRTALFDAVATHTVRTDGLSRGAVAQLVADAVMANPAGTRR